MLPRSLAPSLPRSLAPSLAPSRRAGDRAGRRYPRAPAALAAQETGPARAARRDRAGRCYPRALAALAAQAGKPALNAKAYAWAKSLADSRRRAIEREAAAAEQGIRLQSAERAQEGRTENVWHSQDAVCMLKPSRRRCCRQIYNGFQVIKYSHGLARQQHLQRITPLPHQGPARPSRTNVKFDSSFQ